MSPDTILAITLGVFFILLLASAPVAMALAASGAVGILLLRNFEMATDTLGNTAFNAPADYNLSVVPLYILLGMLALHGQLASRIFVIAAKILGRLPGGLGVATVAACAGFSAVSGSSLATVASLGKLSVGEMLRYGYRPSFAVGIVATAGSLGVLIPPSVILVMYAVLAEESISQVLAGGIIPGILSFILTATFVTYSARRNVVTAGPGELRHAVARASVGAETEAARSTTAAPTKRTGNSARRKSGSVLTAEHPADTGGSNDAQPAQQDTWFDLSRAVVWILIIFAVILLGTFTGLFTIVESAAFGALAALIMVLVESRKHGVKDLFSRIYDSAKESAATTSMAFGLMIGAAIFSVFLVMTRVPVRLTEWVAGLNVPPIVVVIAILLMLIPLGMFLDAFAIIIIVAPLVHPMVTELGFNGVWFAILFTIMIEVGMITPPVGMNAFVVSTATGVRLEETFKGLLPFVGVQLVLIAILILIPDLVTWLPSLAN